MTHQQQQLDDHLVIAAAASRLHLVKKFHTDGYITLTSTSTPPSPKSLLSSKFTNQLHAECLDIFHSVLQHLHESGMAPFPYSRRVKSGDVSEEPVANSAIIGAPLKNYSSKDHQDYEYPINAGLKNGFRELVMRSPGRYELALLVNYHHDSRTCHHESCCCCHDCYDGKRLMSVEWIEQQQRRVDRNNNDDDNASKQIASTAAIPSAQLQRRSSCLQKLLGWIHLYGNGRNNHSNHDNEEDWDRNENLEDEMSMKEFMEFVSDIFTTSSTTCSNDNIKHLHNNNNQYYLCNLSLLISTPGSPTQSWHADGGHTSLTTHEPCHVFNVFIPLIDVPMLMGPTELRPGSQVYTRDLGRMMLLAKVKKRLREPVVPELKRGDALVFDYRILHRGRANLSDGVCDEDEDGDEADGYKSIRKKCCRGRDRPILVLTFARRWFVDVCNFPKRSIFDLQKQK